MNIRELYKEYIAENAEEEKYLKLNTAQKLALKDFVRFVERKMVRDERRKWIEYSLGIEVKGNAENNS